MSLLRRRDESDSGPTAPAPPTAVGPDPLGRLLDLPGVAESGAAARAAVDRLLGHKVLRRRASEVSLEAGLRCARASAAMEGADVPLAELRARLAAGTPPAGREDLVLQGALRASAELGSLVEVWRRSPAQALARVHLLAASGLVDDARLGRPRTGNERADDEDLTLPPPPADVVAARLATLWSVLDRTSAPAVVVAAVVHGELLALRVFADANGVVARTAARLVLVARGLDPKALTAPDVGHAAEPEVYAAAAVGFARGDVASWLLHCANALEAGAVEGLAVAEALSR